MTGTDSATDQQITELLRTAASDGIMLLLERYGARINGALLAEYGMARESMIEEALNIAAYRACRSVDRFEASRGSLGTWLFTITRNELIDRLRRMEVRRWELRQPDELDAMPSADETRPVEPDREYLQALRECVSALPRLQRLVVTADLAAGGLADAKPLADELGTSTNTVYVSRTKARKTLRARLRARGYFREVPE